MTEFKKGQRVHVKGWDGTVLEQTWAAPVLFVRVVSDEDGRTYRVSNNQLEVIPPYEDGKQYVDKWGVVCTFHKESKCWTIASGTEWSFATPGRPMRPVGDEIEE